MATDRKRIPESSDHRSTLEQASAVALKGKGGGKRGGGYGLVSGKPASIHP
jgi:hypothetical protein